MTPEDHAKEAERLLDLASEFRPNQAHAHGLYLKAQVHATLSTRTSTRKASGSTPKKGGSK